MRVCHGQGAVTVVRRVPASPKSPVRSVVWESAAIVHAVGRGRADALRSWDIVCVHTCVCIAVRLTDAEHYWPWRRERRPRPVHAVTLVAGVTRCGKRSLPPPERTSMSMVLGVLVVDIDAGRSGSSTVQSGTVRPSCTPCVCRYIARSPAPARTGGRLRSVVAPVASPQKRATSRRRSALAGSSATRAFRAAACRFSESVVDLVSHLLTAGIRGRRIAGPRPST